jgi:hypothetical protein
MSGSATSDVDLFFEDPANPHTTSRTYSTLHLLRRDIKTCLGINPNTDDETGYQAIWPGTMAIMAGIDLLAKFLAGTDKGQSGPRFKKFIAEYLGPISPDEVETIYQLRNALMHSFGLYSETRKGKVYKFVLSAKGDALVQKRAGDNHWVDILTLHRRFEAAVVAYRADLKSNHDLQVRFDKMFQKYGKVHISSSADVIPVDLDVVIKLLMETRAGSLSSFDELK